ncbi:hypothetical protein HPB51_019521 [Rhipicephalus microplus]|uniref:Uncharacterized protein n=1 Tax=Rhipicephalus microplus TaxID=6941 RepID=A0A9J6EC22_RHIMP|nr:hypothetical protein HPB51_019521 [Rhipicephalus microplus]
MSILTSDYMELLRSLCVITQPSLNDVATIFKEFHRALNDSSTKSFPKQSKSSSSSSGTSKKRSGKSAARGDADCFEKSHSAVGFERSSTWKPGVKPCWIMSDVELWNRILTDNCMELREYRWCELTLMGYEWPEKKPGNKNVREEKGGPNLDGGHDPMGPGGVFGLPY